MHVNTVPDLPSQPASGATDHGGTSLLSVERLTVAFGEGKKVVRAVEDVSLDIRAGEIYAIVGESGCGKSTLAYTMLGIVPHPGKVVAGDVRFRGQSYGQMTKTNLNRVRAVDVSIVFQAAMNAFNPVLSIGRHVEHVLKAHPDVFPNQEEGRSYFRDLLGSLRLQPDEIWNSYESQLSGGMKQRAAIAVALVLKPSVLVLDEPTTALDLLNQRLVIDILKQLQKSLGITIVLVTHDLGIVAEVATRVAVMYAGRLVECGSVEEIFAKDGPRHPYVVALINAIPSVLGQGLLVRPIPGQVPNLAQLPPGCRFAPRCPLAREVCSQVEPALLAADNGHDIACHVVNDQVVRAEGTGQ